jgi:hypothetical protein
MSDVPTLPLHLTRTLVLERSLPGGHAHASAASGLVLVGDTFVVALDDEHHIGVFPRTTTAPGRMVRVLPGDLPAPHAERKRRKPDLETIVRIDGERPGDADMVVALGSGSTAERARAVMLTVERGHLAEAPPAVLALADIYRPLGAAVPDMNIEAGVVLDGNLVLVSRANGSVRHNTVIRFPIDAVRRWLVGRGEPPPPSSMERLDLGTVNEVPLGVTDATVHPDGGWLVSAAAEDTTDSYADGRVVGAALIWLSAALAPVARWRLSPTVKVEGIHAARQGAQIRVWMVTDADDPDVAAGLYEAVLPAVR